MISHLFLRSALSWPYFVVAVPPLPPISVHLNSDSPQDHVKHTLTAAPPLIH